MSSPIVCCPNCGYDATTLQSCLSIAPSPFQHLFDNRTPREEIRAVGSQIKSFTDAMRNELRDLEARVARLHQTLILAKQHHAKAKRVFNAHVMLNPPIESLPTDILSYIFSLTFKKPFNIFGTASEPRMPWLLGQVCRSWRALAWQTPTMWNSFEAQYYDFSRRKFHGPRLEEVLHRSGNSALHVCFGYLAPDCACILARHASRLLELQMTCRFEALEIFGASSQMSMLRQLCLTVKPADFPPSKQVCFDIATKAPRLTRVDLNFISISIDIPHVILLPWPQITHLALELGTHNYHHIFHILSQCWNLVAFTGSYRVSDLSLVQAPSSIYVYPRLTFLDIRSPLAVLPYMQCPALHTFKLRGASIGDAELTETDCEDFRAFMDRSRCTLQRLTFLPEYYLGKKSNYPAPLQELLSFVSHIPDVFICPSVRRLRR